MHKYKNYNKINLMRGIIKKLSKITKLLYIMFNIIRIG